MGTALGLDVDRVLDLLADELAPRLAARGVSREASPWLDVDEAAEYLRCSGQPGSRARRQRVYDLVHQGRLPVAKDGSRSLFRRDWLDAYLEGRPLAELADLAADVDADRSAA